MALPDEVVEYRHYSIAQEIKSRKAVTRHAGSRGRGKPELFGKQPIC